MDKVNLSVFDVFGAIVPGVPLLMLLVFIYGGAMPSLAVTVEWVTNAPIDLLLGAALAAYILGFACHYPAYEVFQPLARLWKKRTKGLAVSIGKRGQELTAIREKSPKNAETLNTFLALRQMCYTLFFGLALLSLYCFGYGIFAMGVGKEPWATGLIAGLLAFLFLRRAVSFQEWAQGHITDTMNAVVKSM
jgi:hypothetical protein